MGPHCKIFPLFHMLGIFHNLSFEKELQRNLELASVGLLSVIWGTIIMKLFYTIIV